MLSSCSSFCELFSCSCFNVSVFSSELLPSFCSNVFVSCCLVCILSCAFSSLFAISKYPNFSHTFPLAENCSFASLLTFCSLVSAEFDTFCYIQQVDKKYLKISLQLLYTFVFVILVIGYNFQNLVLLE